MSDETTLVRVGIFRSPAAFRNFSMDGYAESLSAVLREECGDIATIEEVRPGAARERHARRLPVVGRLGDLGSRYASYLLQARSTRFAVNHVVDHAYGHLAYVLDPLRTIISCHDIFPLKLWKGKIPGMEPRLTPPVTVLASLSGLHRARAVVTSTQATKDDLVALMGVDAARVHVVPYGLDSTFRVQSPYERAVAPAPFRRAGADARYILAVDTGAAYKNRGASIEVLACVRAQSTADVRLVRVGPSLSEADQHRARRCGVAHAIIELGSLTRDELVCVYNLCDVLLFPSFYEGFGWPPLEAMACGLPVVTSRASAITEVVAGAALQADAVDYAALAAHVLKVLGDGVTASRLAERGRAHAATFTWTRAARSVGELYSTILDERGRVRNTRAESEVDTPCAA